jgi:hypothetical protein
MKKTLQVLLISLISTPLFSQTFGIKGGFNFAKMFAIEDGEIYSDEIGLKPGINFGPTVSFPINDMVSFESGLILNSKGYKITDTDYINKLNIYYVDVPITAKVNYELDDFNVFGVFGPYLGLALAGKYKENYEGDKYTERIKIGPKKDDDLKPIDAGITLGAGIGIENVEFSLNFSLGLSNVINSDYVKFKNRVLGLSIAYKFGD